MSVVVPKRVPKTKMTLAPHQVILRPLVTEKGVHRSTRDNQYAFEINVLADKVDVRNAIESLFDVKVTKVRTQNRRCFASSEHYREWMIVVCSIVVFQGDAALGGARQTTIR